MSARTRELPLILIPGVLCDATVWEHQRSSLSDLAAVRVAEHGLHDDSLAAMAQAVLDLAPPQFTVAGHSMGGRIALEIFRQAPMRVAGLALLDTGYKPMASGEKGADERARRAAWLEMARQQGMRAMAQDWVRGMVHPARLTGDRLLVERIVDMLATKPLEMFEAQFRALMHRPDATDLLSAIRCPTLVLCGREDGWSPPAQHEQIAALVPGSILVYVRDCGHMSTMEQPEAVSAALRDWLQTVMTRDTGT